MTGMLSSHNIQNTLYFIHLSLSCFQFICHVPPKIVNQYMEITLGQLLLETTVLVKKTSITKYLFSGLIIEMYISEAQGSKM